MKSVLIIFLTGLTVFLWFSASALRKELLDMKNFLKIIIIGLLFLFVISAAGIFIFLKTFDFNRFKPQIIAARTIK